MPGLIWETERILGTLPLNRQHKPLRVSLLVGPGIQDNLGSRAESGQENSNVFTSFGETRWTGRAITGRKWPEPTFAERARTLVYLGRVGSLSTLSRKQVGFPFGS